MQLCGDLRDAYANAFTNKKVYALAGKESWEALEGSIVFIKKVLYGLLGPSSKGWYAHFDDSLCGIGFTPTWCDKDVWICWLNEDGDRWDYACTHMSMILWWLEMIQKQLWKWYRPYMAQQNSLGLLIIILEMITRRTKQQLDHSVSDARNVWWKQSEKWNAWNLETISKLNESKVIATKVTGDVRC